MSAVLELDPAVSPLAAWQTLAAQNGDIKPFLCFDRSGFKYGNRTNDWGKDEMARGELERPGGIVIPYVSRGRQTGRRSQQQTLLAIDLPGGPGSVLTAQWKANSSPDQYRVTTANWRGVGDTTPFAALDGNTAEALVEDIEALRQASGLGPDEKVVLRGGSWGMTMAAAYAAACPDKVAGLVLGLPFLAREVDFAHNYAADGTLAKKYPDAYTEFMGQENDPKGVLAMLAEEMGESDTQRVSVAFNRFTAWEYARNGEAFVPLENPDPQAVARARVLAHYSANQFFLGENGIANTLQLLPDVPTIVMANSGDPLGASDTLAVMQRQMPKAEFYVYDANWHWVAKENERPDTGFDNRFVSEGYPYGMGRVGLAVTGKLNMKPGVYKYERPMV